MTIRLFDTFTNRTTAVVAAMWTAANSVSILANGIDGKASCEGTSTAGTLTHSYPYGATAFVGIKFQINALSATPLIRFVGTAVNLAQVAITAAGYVQVSRGTTTELAISSVTCQPDVWYWLEVKYVANNTTGSFVVRLNGEEVINITGVDSTAGVENIDSIVIQVSNGGGDPVYDTVYLADSDGGQDFLNDLKGETILPTGAGNYSGWTPLSGSNYQMVDDPASSAPCPDGDTTYNSAGTATTKDSFVYGDLTPTTAVIHGVQVEMYARKDDAGVRELRPFVRLNGTDYFGGTIELSDTYTYYRYIWELNPETSAAWTVSEINGAEFGYELVS